MKMLIDTPDTLILDDVPWTAGVVLAAALVAVLGYGMNLLASGDTSGLTVMLAGGAVVAAAFIAFVARTRLVLDRAAGTVELRHRTVLSNKIQNWPLDQVRHAGAERRRGGRSGPTPTFRPVLVLEGADSPQPINPVYSAGEGARRTAETINAWLGVPGEDEPQA